MAGYEVIMTIPDYISTYPEYDKEYGYKREYCQYLKKFLEIQDEVKDCEVE